MKLKLFYYFYEGVAFLLVTVCCWDMWFTPQDSLPSAPLATLKRALEQGIDQSYLSIREEYAKHKRDLFPYNDDQLGHENIQKRNTLDSLLNTVIAPIDSLKYQLEKMPSNDRAAVKRLMIDQTNAYRLKEKMDRFVVQLQKSFQYLLSFKLEKFAEVNHRHSLWKQNSPKGFAHYFEDITPMLAAVFLSEKQHVAMKYAQKIAGNLNLRGL